MIGCAVALRAACFDAITGTANDWDLASYALGSLAFHAVHARRPADARTIVEAEAAVALADAEDQVKEFIGERAEAS